MVPRITCKSTYSKTNFLAASEKKWTRVSGNRRGLWTYHILHCVICEAGTRRGCHVAKGDACGDLPPGALTHLIHAGEETKIQDESRKRGGKPGSTPACLLPPNPLYAPTPQLPSLPRPFEGRSRSPRRGHSQLPIPTPRGETPCFSTGAASAPQKPHGHIHRHLWPSYPGECYWHPVGREPARC